MADRPAAAAAVVLAVLTGALPTAAKAGLEICNGTDALQSVAIGYKGAEDWTSQGWWNIAPGECATLVAGDLTKRYYYYHVTDSRDFVSQSYVFCTESEAFTIVGDTDCKDRGFETARFREIDTGETATDFTLTFPEQHQVAPEAGNAPAISASGTGPGGMTRGAGSARTAPDETALTDLASGITAGTHGTPFSLDALFQGCELEDGRAYCGFHAEGRKLRAFYDGPTPAAMLHALEALAVNTPVRLQGDRLGVQDLQTAVVLREVTPKPGSDPDAGLRAAMQGDWISEQDQRIGFTIRGSELYTRYDGEFRGARFMRLAATCDAAGGAGPVLVQTKLKDRSTACFVIEKLGDGVMELTDPSRGARLRYVADR